MGDNAHKNVFRYSYLGGGHRTNLLGEGHRQNLLRRGGHRTNSNLLGEKGKRHRTNSMSKKIYWGGHRTKLKVGC